MPFFVVRQDITKMRVDAIVNAANTDLAMGGGVCGAIFRAAGPVALQAVCHRLGPIKTGEAVITSGFALPCQYIIHTAGPVYNPRAAAQSEVLLRAAYRNALHLAADYGCESVAFPLISSGIYGYPKAEALWVACSEIRAFLQAQDMKVTLAVFDRDAFAVSEALLGEVDSYLDEHYAAVHRERTRLLEVEERALQAPAAESLAPPPAPNAAPPRRSATPCVGSCFGSTGAGKAPAAARGMEEVIGQLDEPFSQTLLRLIDEKGKTDTEVYKRANLDRKLFSKIRVGKGYCPGKRTVLALCVGLELTLPETERLLRCAGFALSHSRIDDVIVEYFLAQGRYDIDEINAVLFHYDQALLGG